MYYCNSSGKNKVLHFSTTSSSNKVSPDVTHLPPGLHVVIVW